MMAIHSIKGGEILATLENVLLYEIKFMLIDQSVLSFYLC